MVIPPPIRGLGQAGGFQMMVEDRKGLGLEELQKATNELIQAGNSEQSLRGLASTFNASSPQLYLDIDRTKAQSFQVPLNNVFETLRGYLGSSFVNLFNKFNQVYQVYIQASDRYRREARGHQEPLHPKCPGGDGASRQSSRGQAFSRVRADHPLQPLPCGRHLRLGRSGIQLRPGPQADGAAGGGYLPQGMGYDWTATSYQEKQVGYQAYFIHAMSITLVFMVLAALYESWTSPAAVILVVPMALVGVLLGLLIRGFDNNLYTQIGLVLMIALASKNAILIVEFARDLQRQGMSVADAAVEATSRRFRPIVMTSFAFILGVAPLLIASGRRRCQPAGNRHRGLRRHDRLDAAGHSLCAGFLRGHAAAERKTFRIEETECNWK